MTLLEELRNSIEDGDIDLLNNMFIENNLMKYDFGFIFNSNKILSTYCMSCKIEELKKQFKKCYNGQKLYIFIQLNINIDLIYNKYTLLFINDDKFYVSITLSNSIGFFIYDENFSIIVSKSKLIHVNNFNNDYDVLCDEIKKYLSQECKNIYKPIGSLTKSAK